VAASDADAGFRAAVPLVMGSASCAQGQGWLRPTLTQPFMSLFRWPWAALPMLKDQVLDLWGYIGHDKIYREGSTAAARRGREQATKDETPFQGRLHTAVAGVAGSCEVVVAPRGGCKLL